MEIHRGQLDPKQSVRGECQSKKKKMETNQINIQKETDFHLSSEHLNMSMKKSRVKFSACLIS